MVPEQRYVVLIFQQNGDLFANGGLSRLMLVVAVERDVVFVAEQDGYFLSGHYFVQQL